jgi:ParB family chromosome partitioning protein
MTLSLEHHQVQLRYTAVRSTSPSKERRVLSSLADIGQQCPVVVVVDRAPRHYVLIDGYKRMRALSKLHCDTVVASCWELSEADALIMERLLSRPRSDGPLEQGWLLSELKVRFGLSHHELACRFAVSESWVSRRLALVQQAPDFVQRAVREGRIVAHAAMKYLVPLARAKTDDARRLCEAIAPLSLSSRQVGALYAAYQQADAKGRELILTQPAIVLRAETEMGCDDDPRPDPVAQVVRDADILCAVALRMHNRLQPEVQRRLCAAQRDQIAAAVQQAGLSVDQLRQRLAVKRHQEP